jgi:hypothetical protein
VRRQGELSIRLALGASHQRMLRLALGEGALLVCIGVLIAIPGVYAAGGLIRVCWSRSHRGTRSPSRLSPSACWSSRWQPVTCPPAGY